MPRRVRVYKIWSVLIMFGIGTELLIWWRKGKRECVNSAGGIFEFYSDARKQFVSLWEFRLINASFSKSEMEHKDSGKGLTSAFFLLYVYGQVRVFFLSF